MRTRYVTYDIKDGNSYDKLYEFLEKFGGTQITKSTYVVKTNLKLEDFSSKLKTATSYGDTVLVISVSNKNEIFHYKVR